MSEPRGVQLTAEQLADRYDQIRDVYRADRRPWVIGYSGGKDSTTALQLIWRALSELPREERTKPVFVIASDTLVETPQVAQHIDGSLGRMNKAAGEQQLPFSAHKVSPRLEDSFWVNLLGRGYPAPSQRFRWCTDRMKIQPANRFILEKVAEFGEVVLVLGVRRAESATRAQVMSLHRIKGSALSRHTTLPNAYVYTPVEDFTVDDIWTYLLQVASPWGANNRELVTLYRNSQAGECPLVVDTTTPSCGSSRFGCWVCTVVTQDKMMESLVEKGEDWMEPMLEFRNLLSSTQDPAVKAQVRDHKRRDGRVYQTESGFIPGPYKVEFRKELLRRLLTAQKDAQANGPDPIFQLISFEELEEIRRLWRTEGQDWEDSVPRIFKQVMGVDRPWLVDEQASFSGEERGLLNAVCDRHAVPAAMVAKLLDVERELHGMSRRSAIYQRINDIFDEDWRTREEVLAAGHARQ